MSQSSVRVTPYSSALGAVISGADLARPISDADFAVIRQAFLDHGVIFFRDQHLTPEQHLNFARRFAPIDINRFFKAVDGYPEIAEVRKEAEQTTNIGGGWHTDHSYDQVPAMGSVLLAREVPPSGGDTLFASMSKVYEALSAGLKSTLDRLCAVHSSRHVFGDKGGYAKTSDLGARIGDATAAVQDAVHPVVDSPPRNRPQDPVCEFGLHAALRGLDCAGKRAAAALPVPVRRAPGIQLPLAVAGRFTGLLGQSGHLALCAERLPWPPAVIRRVAG